MLYIYLTKHLPFSPSEISPSFAIALTSACSCSYIRRSNNRSFETFVYINTEKRKEKRIFFVVAIKPLKLS